MFRSLRLRSVTECVVGFSRRTLCDVIEHLYCPVVDRSRDGLTCSYTTTKKLTNSSVLALPAIPVLTVPPGSARLSTAELSTTP
jgi:hypothetical protein